MDSTPLTSMQVRQGVQVLSTYHGPGTFSGSFAFLSAIRMFEWLRVPLSPFAERAQPIHHITTHFSSHPKVWSASEPRAEVRWALAWILHRASAWVGWVCRSRRVAAGLRRVWASAVL